MKLRSAAVTMAIVAGTISGACTATSGNPSGTGGSSSGTAGTTGTAGNTGSCTNGTACGGSVVGTWNVTSSCLDLSSSNLDIALAGLDPTSCMNVTMTGSLSVTGTFTANADGSYTDATSTMGTATLQLPAGCLRLSGTMVTCDGLSRPLEGLGFASLTCINAAGGGCTCTGTVQHPGSLGLPSVDPQTMGGYEISGNTLTTDSVPAGRYAYCVSGNNLTMMPQSTNPNITGTIVLQKSSTTGTAGTGGGAGGTTGAGGEAGGTTGAGGSSSGAGGTTGSAGRGGTTGAAGSGTAGRGGATGSAGTGGAGGRGGGGGSGGSGGTTGSAGTGGTGGSSGRVDGPCDIYAAANTPCAAAYSMVRALAKAYTGPLYQVRSGSSAMNTGSGGMLRDIGQTADGFADTATQDAFCANTICTVAQLYDHSGNANHLPVAKRGRSDGGAFGAMDDFESAANKGMMMIRGHKVYSLYMNAREGYRIMRVGTRMPVGSASQGIYELADGTHSGTACCWDFGNVTTNPMNYADMNTLFFGVAFWGKGAGSGPWMMADFEAGVWAGGSRIGDPGWGGLNDAHPINPNNPSLKVPFAFGLLKTSSSQWTLKGADAQTATSLTLSYQGAMPKPISNIGAIVLGVGGDNSNNSWGTFYEGAIVAGYPTDATDLAIFNNVKAVGYTR
jgi:hypothetical protein